MLDAPLKYDEYVDSGQPWLGKIPATWALLRNKALFKEQTSAVGKASKDYKLLSLTLGGVIPRDMENPKGKFPAEFDTYKKVAPDDLVFCLFDVAETPRAVGRADEAGMITGAYTILRANPSVNSRYLTYYYLSLDYDKRLSSLYTGLRNVIKIDTFMSIRTPVPDLDTQNRIVSFLDEKTAEINAAIEKKRRLIDLLSEQKAILINRAVTKGLNPTSPMKDSGVDWIGEIPAHWDVMFNRRIFREKPRQVDIQNEQQLSLSQVDGVIPTKNMTERSLKALNKDNFKLCLPGDLVVNRFKGHLGVFFESSYRGIVTFHYGVFEPSEFAITKYYELLFHTGQYRTVFAGRSNGMTLGLQNLSNQNFYDVKSLVPPESEQTEIVKYVEEKSIPFERAVALSLREISTLNEFKQTLIANAVTGKIKI